MLFPRPLASVYTPAAMILLANTLPVVMFLTGVGLLTAILLRRSFRYFGRQTRRRKNEAPIDHQPRPIDVWAGAQHDVAAHIQRQEVEFFDMARDVTGQLDSKMLLLQQLMAQSNEQIARMEQLLEEMEQPQV